MNAANGFVSINSIAIVGWLMMAFAPRSIGTKWVVHRGFLPLGMSLLYTIVLFFNWGNGEGNFQTLAGVRQLFQNDWALLMGWAHYLAYDMLVGSWALQDSWKKKIPHGIMIPLLFLMLMIGPVGYLSYRIVASFQKEEKTEKTIDTRE